MVMSLHFCQTGWRTRGPGLSHWCRLVVSSRESSAPSSIPGQPVPCVNRCSNVRHDSSCQGGSGVNIPSFLLLFLNTSIHKRNRFCWWRKKSDAEVRFSPVLGQIFRPFGPVQAIIWKIAKLGKILSKKVYELWTELRSRTGLRHHLLSFFNDLNLSWE